MYAVPGMYPKFIMMDPCKGGGPAELSGITHGSCAECQHGFGIFFQPGLLVFLFLGDETRVMVVRPE